MLAAIILLGSVIAILDDKPFAGLVGIGGAAVGLAVVFLNAQFQGERQRREALQSQDEKPKKDERESDKPKNG